jgi:hypothetical protein
LGSGVETPPYAIEGWCGAAYAAVGQPERWAQLCATALERRGDDHVFLRSCRVFGLTFAGAIDQAAATAEGLIEAAAATDNPYMHTFAIAAATCCQLSTADPARCLDACRLGLTIVQESGNSFNETILALFAARLEALDAVTVEALNHVMLAVQHYHDSGNLASVRSPLAVLSAFLDRLGAFEPAATIAGFAADPLAFAAVPEFTSTTAHLREVLGDQYYESLAREGEVMTMAAIAAYAYDQIDRARTELEQLR